MMTWNSGKRCSYNVRGCSCLPGLLCCRGCGRRAVESREVCGAHLLWRKEVSTTTWVREGGEFGSSLDKLDAGKWKKSVGERPDDMFGKPF